MNFTSLVSLILNFALSAFAESVPGLTDAPAGYAQEIARLELTEAKVAAAAAEKNPRRTILGPRWSERYYVAPYYRGESRYYFASSIEVILQTSKTDVLR